MRDSYGGVQMKLKGFCLAASLAVVVAMAAGTAKADGVDPVVRTGGDPSGSPLTIILQNFTISTETGNSPATSPCVLSQGGITQDSDDCLFINGVTTGDDVGSTIDALVFDFASEPEDDVSCSTVIGDLTSVFGTCSVTNDGAGGALVTFSGGTGIGFLDEFSVELDDFAAGTVSSVYANVPEPSGILLLSMGLVALFAFGRKRVLSRSV